MDALIIGGTGTLGHAVAPLLLAKGYHVSVISREELKQKKMRALYPEIKFILGDVRDYESIAIPMLGKDLVLHFAAMKHVDLAEENILESIKINLLGTQNVAKACYGGSVGQAVFSSTDKAVLPINVYGMCKGISERLWLDYNNHGATEYSVFRWGNVLGSRGSVIHAFKETLLKEKKAYITDMGMTRFWIHIDDAAKFLVDNVPFAPKDGVLIPPMKAAYVKDVARAVAAYLGIVDFSFVNIPIRPGEKLHESLDYHDPDKELKSSTAEHYTAAELYRLVERTLCPKS